MVPLEVQNFPEAGTRKDQQAQCGGGVRPDNRAASGFLRGMLGLWLRLIYGVWQPDCFSLPDGLADPRPVRNCPATSARVDARLSAARWAAGSAPWATEPSVFLASVRASSGVMVPAFASVRRLVGALRPLPARYFTT